MSTAPKNNPPDYFGILGVPPDATTEDIKRAYREKARLYHPDVSQAPDAAERFREVVEAYSVLTDADQRAAYVLSQNTRATAPKRQTRPDDIPDWFYTVAKPRRRRVLHPSLIFFHVGLLLLGLSIAYVVLEELTQVFAVAWAAEPTQCQVIAWEATPAGQRLRYQALVPWQLEPYQSTRMFEQREADYALGQTFDCFYYQTDAIAAPLLQRYDMREIRAVVPWGLISVLFISTAVRFFWPQRHDLLSLSFFLWL